MNQTITAFGYPSTLIKEYDHWVALLRPQQVTIGTLVIAAKSDATQLGDLTTEQWTEFATVSRDMEVLLTKVFSAEKFNYLALMMKDPHPHFHFVPRYSKPVMFNGKEYIDTDWPSKTELKKIEMLDEDFDALKEVLLKEI